MREAGMRHLEQNEQGIDHGKHNTDENSGRDVGAQGVGEALGIPRGTKIQGNTGPQTISIWSIWLPSEATEDQKGQKQRLCSELQLGCRPLSTHQPRIFNQLLSTLQSSSCLN